jgi:hypothetical protein
MRREARVPQKTGKSGAAADLDSYVRVHRRARLDSRCTGTHKCRGRRDAQERPTCRMHKCAAQGCTNAASGPSRRPAFRDTRTSLCVAGCCTGRYECRERQDVESACARAARKGQATARDGGRYDSMDGGGRAASGTAAESNAGRYGLLALSRHLYVRVRQSNCRDDRERLRPCASSAGQTRSGAALDSYVPVHQPLRTSCDAQGCANAA